jgi:guanyl-specific ribonuclease Sa
LVPGAGEAADAFNVGVSMYRGDSEGATLSLGAMMPVGGWGPGVSKLAKDFKRIMDKTGVTDWFKGLFSKSTKVKVDSPSYGEVVDDVAENVDAAKVTDQAARFVTTAEGVVHDLKPTLDRIASGGKFPHRNDGSIFKNMEGLLPKQNAGYYKEFVHPTPGVKGPGAMRVVTGQGGEMWFTPDHYKTFIPIR